MCPLIYRPPRLGHVGSSPTTEVLSRGRPPMGFLRQFTHSNRSRMMLRFSAGLVTIDTEERFQRIRTLTLNSFSPKHIRSRSNIAKMRFVSLFLICFRRAAFRLPVGERLQISKLQSPFNVIPSSYQGSSKILLSSCA